MDVSSQCCDEGISSLDDAAAGAAAAAAAGGGALSVTTTIVRCSFVEVKVKQTIKLPDN